MAAQLQLHHFVPRMLPRPGPEAAAHRPTGRHGHFLKALTVGLVETYRSCSGDFKFAKESVPQRVLTKPAEPAHNNNWDNCEFDYICRVRDVIQSASGKTFEILDWLGCGTFGQVVKCQVVGGAQDERTFVALKVIKNKTAYTEQARVEVSILQRLNETPFEPQAERRVVRMFEHFTFRKHLCIAFELLDENLYQVLQRGRHRGLSLEYTNVVTKQLLEALQCLVYVSIVHCDLKPENVMLKSLSPIRVKLIDFGSACLEDHPVHSYIQSRFYRSPEVLLGLRYSSAIDMWSLGCITAEMFWGHALFPGITCYDQVRRIVKVLGMPPEWMLRLGKQGKRYFRRSDQQLQPAGGHAGLTCRGVGLPEREGLSAPSKKEPLHEQRLAERNLRGAGGRLGEVLPEAGEAGAGQELAAASEAPAGAPASGGACFTRGPSALLQRAASSTATATTDGGGCASTSTCTAAGATEASAVGCCGSSCGSGASVRQESQTELQHAEEAHAATKDAWTGWQLKSPDEFRHGLGREERRRLQQQEEKRGLVPSASMQSGEVRSLDHFMQTVTCKAIREVSEEAWLQEQERRLAIRQFLGGLLTLGADARWTPKQALQHPFVTGLPHVPSYCPARDESTTARGPCPHTANDPGSVTFDPPLRRTIFSSATATPDSSPRGSGASTHRSERNSLRGQAERGGSNSNSNSNRPSSPWHLASDISCSSHLSGSESCTSRTEEGDAHLPRSIRSGHLSSGDSEAPHSEPARDTQDQRWRSLEEVAQAGLLPKRMSPGGTSGASAANFRESTGFGSSGPVVPLRQGQGGSSGSGRGSGPLPPGSFLANAQPSEESASSTRSARSLPLSARSAGSWNSTSGLNGPGHSSAGSAGGGYRRRRHGRRRGSSS